MSCCSSTSGMNPVIVHGGGPEITKYMERLGLEVEFVRRTARVRRGDGRGGEDGADRQAQQGHRAAPQPARPVGGRAVRRRRARCSAVRKRPWPGPTARRATSGSSGAIEQVDVDVLNHIAEDYIPVVASVGADAEGNSYNVNADEAAGAVAAALGAYKVIFLTDVRGLARRPGDDPSSLISETDVERDPARHRRGARRAAGCCRSSRPVPTRSSGGVRAAHIVDGRVPHSLLLELFTDAGIGTKVAVSDERPSSSQALDERYVMQTYKRAPVEFVLGEGAHALRRATGEAVPRLPGRHLGLQRRPLPSARGGGGAPAGRRG